MHQRLTVFGALALAAGAVTMSLVGTSEAQEREKSCACCAVHVAPPPPADLNRRFQLVKATGEETVVMDGRTGVIYRTGSETVVVVDPIKAAQLTRRLEVEDARGVIQGGNR